MKTFKIKTEIATFYRPFPTSIDATIWAINAGCRRIFVTVAY